VNGRPSGRPFSLGVGERAEVQAWPGRTCKIADILVARKVTWFDMTKDQLKADGAGTATKDTSVARPRYFSDRGRLDRGDSAPGRAEMPAPPPIRPPSGLICGSGDGGQQGDGPTNKPRGRRQRLPATPAIGAGCKRRATENRPGGTFKCRGRLCPANAVIGTKVRNENKDTVGRGCRTSISTVRGRESRRLVAFSVGGFFLGIGAKGNRRPSSGATSSRAAMASRLVADGPTSSKDEHEGAARLQPPSGRRPAAPGTGKIRA